MPPAAAAKAKPVEQKVAEQNAAAAKAGAAAGAAARAAAAAARLAGESREAPEAKRSRVEPDGTHKPGPAPTQRLT